MAIFNKTSRIAAVAVVASQLSGCVAAALPLAALAMPAISGFVLYKSFQTVSGGSVEVGFDAKSVPPLAPASRLAVWPEDEGNVRLAELLSSAGKTVTSPSAVAGHAIATGSGTNLKLMTTAERTAAFTAVCARSRVELILASTAEGSESQKNFFSFSRANQTFRASLFAYSCAQRTIVWQDRIAAVVEQGDRLPSQAEISQVAAQAWSERILEAMRTP